MKVAAFVGRSGSGKTTAIAALIKHFVGAGRTVGAIKHTHHPLNDEDRGDTAEFRRAGARAAVLAGDTEAIVFSDGPTRRIQFDDARDLLRLFSTDIVFIEGFKSVDAWPRIELTANERRTADELLENLDKIWRP